MFRKLMAAVVFASACILAAGCTELGNFVNAVQVAEGTAVTANDVYVAANAFDAAEQTAINYLNLPACNGSGGVVCRTQSGSAAVYKAMNAGIKLRAQLVAQITGTSGQPVSTTALAALKTATSSIIALVQ